MNILQTENLSKKFGDFVAIDNVSVNVREGEIYGFLGLNGAGKTTTIRLMLGMIRPTSGSVSIFGQTLSQAAAVWNDVGYMVETPCAYPDLTVTENLKVFAKLRGIKENELINNVIERLQLSAYRHKRAKHLSLGNGQRLGLAKALLHHPRLLILDEPVNGLDPAGIVEIRAFLKELAHEQGTTIFLSSHILSEISHLASRIGIVHNGKLLKEINTSDLEQQLIKKISVNTHNNPAALALLNSKNLGFAVAQNNLLESSQQQAIAQPDIIATLLVNNQLPPTMLNVSEEDLEAYFLRLIRQ